MPNSKKQKAENSKNKRSQTAVEYLSVFSWVLLILIIIIVALSYFVSNRLSSTNLPATCIISAALNCKQVFIMSNSVSTQAVIVFTNNLGSTLQFSQNSFIIQPQVSGAPFKGVCYPANAVPGSSVVCTATLTNYQTSLGTQLNPKFSLKYQICTSSACQPGVLNTTGTSTVYVSQYTPTHAVTVATSAGTGGVSINGVKYPSGTTVLFLGSVNYQISPNLPSGYVFSRWTVTGGANVNNNASITATAKAIANGTITAVVRSPGTVTLNFPNYVVAQGASNVGTGVGDPTDTIIICVTPNGGGASNPACSGAETNVVATGSPNSGLATYDTSALGSGTYSFEACSLTFYRTTGKAGCSPVVTVLITPLVTLRVQSSSIQKGASDPMTVATSNAVDTVILCSSYNNNPNNVIYACGSQNNIQLQSGTGSFTTSVVSTFPIGTYTFVACDLSFYTSTGRVDCNPNPVSVAVTVPAAPSVVLGSFDSPQQQGFMNQAAARITTSTTDYVMVCSTSATVGGSLSGNCPATYPYSMPITTTYFGFPLPSNTAYIDISSYPVGTYNFVACDKTYSVNYGVTDCSTQSSAQIIPSAPAISIEGGRLNSSLGTFVDIGACSGAGGVAATNGCMNPVSPDKIAILYCSGSTCTPTPSSGTLITGPATNYVNLNPYKALPHGTWSFVACDYTYYTTYNYLWCTGPITLST